MIKEKHATWSCGVKYEQSYRNIAGPAEVKKMWRYKLQIPGSADEKLLQPKFKTSIFTKLQIFSLKKKRLLVDEHGPNNVGIFKIKPPNFRVKSVHEGKPQINR